MQDKEGKKYAKEKVDFEKNNCRNNRIFDDIFRFHANHEFNISS